MDRLGGSGRKTVLVTGFSPFPGAPINPTEHLMRRLPRLLGAEWAGVSFVYRVLPTTWAGRLDVTDALRRSICPDAIVHFGVDGSRKTLNVETRAVNVATRVRPDAEGLAPDRAELLAGAKRHRFATLPVRRLVAAARRHGAPVKLSVDAGTYLCNATLWDSIGSGIPSVFVHVPGPRRGRRSRRPSAVVVEQAAVNLLREVARLLR